MSFLNPGAFAGLATILILLLLSLWRQRPPRRAVPSLRIWKLIPDRIPPLRALQRPRPGILLLIQSLVVVALVSALAGPGVVRHRPAPRKIAVVLDVSAPMLPRMEDARRELFKLDPSDVVVLFESPGLVRHEGLAALGAIKGSDRAGDPGPALDLAASESKQIILVSDRATSWVPPPGVILHQALVGGPLPNAGIVDANVHEGKLFLRMTGPAEVEVAIAGRTRRLPKGETALVDLPPDATKIEASLPPDGFPADDRVVLERGSARVEVALEGRPDAAIQAALESNPRARIVRNGSPRLRIRVAAGANRNPAPVVVEIDPAEGVEEWMPAGPVSVAAHELTRGVEARDLQFTEVGRLKGPLEAVLFHGPGGSPVAAVRRPGEIVIAVRYASSGWPLRQSFPIFWANVVELAGAGGASWSARGLLDASASRLGRERRPLDPAALGDRPLAASRTDFTAGAILAAAVFLAVLYVMERRAGRDA